MTDEKKQITITSMAYGGKGVAREDGKVWFVDRCVIGDEVMASPTATKPRYVEASVDHWVDRSPLRQPSPCSVSGECGGCQWLEVPYAEQLEWKRSFVENALKRIGRLENDSRVKITGSPDSLHYRNRILLRAYGQGDRLDVGYFRASSRELVPVPGCKIADPILNQLIGALKGIKAPADSKWRLECQVIGLRREQITVTVYPGDRNTPGTENLVRDISAIPFVAWAGTVFQLPEAPLLLLEEDLGIKFHTFPGQFQQINSALNRELRRIVSGLVERYEPKRVLDVFCGSGNLSLVLARPGRYVEAIEANKKAIVVGHRNAEVNGLDVKFLAGDAEAHLWKCSKKKETFDVVVLDPPREGMYQGCIPLKEIAPKAIVYVSCDPNTLARDIGALTKKGKYELVHVEALDFFPNTYHVETVAVLERR